MATELAVAGRIIVSGLARGIDTTAHTGALNSGDSTIEVVGCGIYRTNRLTPS